MTGLCLVMKLTIRVLRLQMAEVRAIERDQDGSSYRTKVIRMEAG